MEFAQRIYHGDKPLVLTDNSSNYKGQFPEAIGYTVFEGTGGGSEYIEQAIRSLMHPKVTGVILSGLNREDADAMLADRYRLILAAGGLVRNEQGQILMIRRLGKWDLPKGKCEPDEDVETCAIREVEEETGIGSLKIHSKICDTWHVYRQHDEDILKQTSWFRMQTAGMGIPVAQTEEQITEVRWVDSDAVAHFLVESYETIREVFRTSGLI